MRAIDLALYADVLAGEAAALSARAEHARARLRQAEIERQARGALPSEAVARLEALGIFSAAEALAARDELQELAVSLAALRELQAWVEARLAAAEAGPRRDGWEES